MNQNFQRMNGSLNARRVKRCGVSCVSPVSSAHAGRLSRSSLRGSHRATEITEFKAEALLGVLGASVANQRLSPDGNGATRKIERALRSTESFSDGSVSVEHCHSPALVALGVTVPVNLTSAVLWRSPRQPGMSTALRPPVGSDLPAGGFLFELVQLVLVSRGDVAHLKLPETHNPRQRALAGTSWTNGNSDFAAGSLQPH